VNLAAPVGPFCEAASVHTEPIIARLQQTEAKHKT